MNKTTIARRYATALFNLLEATEHDPVRDALHLISRLVADSPHLKHIFASPVFTFDDKHAVLAELVARIQAPGTLKDFLAQVLKKGRIGLLQEIAEAFGALVDQARGIQPVMIVSAQPFAADEQQELRAKLETAMHKQVTLSCAIDPALLAGLRIRIGSRVYDNTIQGRLSTLRSLLAKG